MDLQTKQGCVFTKFRRVGHSTKTAVPAVEAGGQPTIGNMLGQRKDVACSKLGQTLLERVGMRMLSRCLEGRVGYFCPRLALLFSQGGSRTTMSNPASLSPGMYSARSQIVIYFLCSKFRNRLSA